MLKVVPSISLSLKLKLMEKTYFIMYGSDETIHQLYLSVNHKPSAYFYLKQTFQSYHLKQIKKTHHFKEGLL